METTPTTTTPETKPEKTSRKRQAAQAAPDAGTIRGDLSLSGYWAFGRTEDRFQAEKREPVGVVL